MTTELLGFLNVNKPAGKTSHDVVAAIRRLARIKQVGHGGTLDPMAEGVLLVALGKACRLLRFVDGRKTYLAKIQFGLVTTTDDVEGETLKSMEAWPSLAEIQAVLPSFEGQISQVPPIYSAIHVDGKRLYQLAREGKAPDVVPPRQVFVHYLQLLNYDPPFLFVRIACSAGTYIRSIARDLGQLLGCGGCLAGLTREQVGPLELNGAKTLEELKSAAELEDLQSAVLSPQCVLNLDCFEIDPEQARLLCQGQALTMHSAEVQTNQENVLALCDGQVIAVCKQSRTENSSLVKIQPEVVLVNG